MRKVFKRKSFLIPGRKIRSPLVDHKFAKMVDDFINNHEDVLQALSHR